MIYLNYANIHFPTKKIKKVIKSVDKVCIIFKYKKNYLVFKNDDGLFLGLYTFNLVDHDKVESFLKNKTRIENILTSKKKILYISPFQIKE